MRRFKGIKIILICVLLMVHTIRCETDEDFGTEEPEEDIYESYMRCQETQRCPMAYNKYDEETTIETYFYSRFRDGVLDQPFIFCDFENPLVGTHGWRKTDLNESQYYQEDMDVLHFSSYDDELPLEEELEMLEGTITINTDIPTFVRDDDNTVIEGTFLQTPIANRTVAVFNFKNIIIGEDVTLNVSGSYPLAIISRNNFIFNGTVEVPPGNLSGFLGVNDTDYYNKWGRGANPTMFYFFTLNFSVEPNPEVQWINTTVYTGDVLSGTFTIDIGSECHTVPISSNASVEELKQAIDDCSDYFGIVTVNREIRERGMNHWTITFDTAIGDIPQLTINSDELRGYEHNIFTGTYNDGNVINGSYSLIFTDKDDNDIIVDGFTPNMTAKEMEDMIIDKVPYIYNITIAKSCPDYYECKNGFCDSQLGCYYGWGHSYYITIQTKYDIAVIDTPTDIVELYNPMNITVESDLYDSSNIDDEVNITIVPYHVNNKFGEYIPYNLTDIPFVYYYGSFGGSYGGKGGGIIESAPIYGDNDIRDFSGGSSGALGTIDYHNIFDVPIEERAGGSGGGAIEFSAVNDLYIFETAKITVNGENGKENKGRGSGGGSGGAIVLSAGGIVENKGILQANGGDGGNGSFIEYAGGGGGGGRITVYAQSYFNHRPDLTVAKGGKSPNPLYNGEDGVVYKNVKYNMNITIDVTGTMGTNHSLLVQGAEEILIDQPMNYSSYIISGPQHSLLNDTEDNNIEDGPKPTRVSFYMRVKLLSNQTNWGGFFCLHSNEVDNTRTSSLSSNLPKYLMMIGTAYVDGTFRYGANNRRTPANTVSSTAPPDLSKLLLDNVEEMKWYRFDYLIDWENHVFEIMIDGITRAWDVFYGDYTTTVGLYNLYPLTVWYDEIFIGGDHLTGFHNPRIFNDKDYPYDPIINTTTFTFTAWDVEDIGNETSYHEETEHHSHLYRRQKYHSCSNECSATCNNSMIWFDGPPHMKYLSDIKDRDDQPYAQSTFSMASVIYVPDNQTKVETYLERYVTAITNSSTNSPNPNSQGKVGRYYWYSSQYETPLIYTDPSGVEYEYTLPFYNKTLNKTDMNFIEQNISMSIVCSSTDDFINWRYEGIMLYSVNVTDDEDDRKGMLGFDKPKVLYNEKNDNYVMWFLVDDAEHTYGANGIAISDRPNGPFTFLRTFLPDGNETHDSTVIKRKDGIAFLVRTYYQTYTYWLPAPVMQPMWESVKLPPRPDEIKEGDDYNTEYDNENGFKCPGYFTTCGIDENCKDPEVNYALNYHRAFYSPEYDNQHDIYMQRWRLEDKRWNIAYYKRETTAEMNLRVKNTLEWLKNNTDKDFEDYPDQPYIYKNGIWYEIADVEYRGSIRYIYNYNNNNEEEEEERMNLYNVSVVDRFDGLMNLKETESLGSIIFFKYDNSSNTTLSLEKQSQELKEELYASCCNNEYATCCSLFDEATPTLEIVIRLVHSLMVDSTDDNNHKLYLDFYDLSKEKPPITNYLHVWDMKRVIYGQGDPYGSISRNANPDPFDGTLISRFLDPNRTENSCWHPSSVPAVKAQDWKDNYYDNNIADNPIHPTVPDKLIAPEHIVFERRTKYIAISQLTDDYTDTLGVAYILEGETLDDEPLVDLVEQFDPFNFSTLVINQKSDTKQRHFHGDVKPPFNFTTADDWETRYWQYYDEPGDRWNDTVNFRDQITEGHT